MAGGDTTARRGERGANWASPGGDAVIEILAAVDRRS